MQGRGEKDWMQATESREGIKEVKMAAQSLRGWGWGGAAIFSVTLSFDGASDNQTLIMGQASLPWQHEIHPIKQLQETGGS